MDNRDPAVGHWREILEDAGIDSSVLTGKQVPCPMCGGSDRFRFDDKDGRGTWFCNVEGAGDGYKLLEAKFGEPFKEAIKRLRKQYGGMPPPKPKPDRDWRKYLNKLWSEALPSHPMLNAYLKSRGLPPLRDPDVIRFHANTPWSDGDAKGHAPAMLAKVCQDGKPMTIHRTFLTDDSPRRKMIMPHNGTMNGAYIPLFGRTGDSLGVAEGIETALSSQIMLAPGVPVWACISASQLERFNPEENVERLLIFGDNDATFTGQAAAYALAKRIFLNPVKKRVVEVHIPPVAGEDWNDVLKQRK